MYLSISIYLLSSGQNVGIHRRLALRVLLVAGTGRRRLLAAFMLVTTALSMFICNTATTAMMVGVLYCTVLYCTPPPAP